MKKRSPLAVLFPIPLSVDLSARIKEMETGPIDSVTGQPG